MNQPGQRKPSIIFSTRPWLAFPRKLGSGFPTHPAQERRGPGTPAPAGSLKDDREMRGVAAASLKGLLHPLNGYSDQGPIYTADPYQRQSYFIWAK